MFGIAYTILAQAMSEAWGETVTTDYVHKFCKDKFRDVLKENQIGAGVVTLKSKSGNVITTDAPVSTSTLTTKGMMLYYEHLQRFGAWMGVDIPNPNEIPFEQIKEA